MKLSILIALFFSVMVFSTTMQAEETISAPEKTKSIFTKASDKQINEAQRFYKKCISNKTFSKKKNCKCAATSYLATRLELGDAATPSQIMDKNVNLCLNNKEDETTAQTDLSKITDAQLKESNEAYERCKSNAKISRSFDCECFGARYLDKRLELGPIVSYDEIFLTLRNECRNIIETTGFEYTQCMKYTRYSPPNNIEAKDYCECFASQWGKRFKAYKGQINIHSKRRIKTRSTSYCLQPEAYKNK